MAIGRSRARACLALALGAVCSVVSTASAHISLEMASPSTHKSRNGDDGEGTKMGPCGRGPNARGSDVYTYEPGSTIILNVAEYVLHPGYFRVAFSMNGDADFMEPQAIMPMNRECMNGEMRCGKTDFCNNPGVLLDNLDEHWQMDGTRTPNPPPQYSWAVKLPDVECDNCTLQVIQIMTYPLGPAHGPFDLAMDIYHQCIDITLKRGAGAQMNPPPAPKPLKGIDCKAAANMGAAGAGAAGAGGSAGGGAAGATGSAGGSAMAGGSGGSSGAAAASGNPAGAGAAGSQGRPAVAGMSAGAGAPAPKGGSSAPPTGAAVTAGASAPAPLPSAAAPSSGGCGVAPTTGSSGLKLGAALLFALAASVRRRRAFSPR